VFKEDLISLADYNQKLKEFSDQGHLLAIEQIADSFKHKIFSDSIIHCVALTRTSLSPSLSVSWINNNVVFYNNLKKLKECLRDTNAYPMEEAHLYNYTSHNSTNYTILLKNLKNVLTAEEKKKLCELESSICESTKKSCLHLRNLERDVLIHKYNDLKEEMKNQSDYALSNLCSFIRNHEHLSVVPVYFNSEFVLDYSTDEIGQNQHALSDCILNTGSQQYRDRIRFLFIESVNTGKPLSGFRQDVDFFTFFILIPVIRKTEALTRIRDVLLVYSNDPIPLQSIDCIIDCVDLFVSYTMTERKLNEIISIQQEVLNIPKILKMKRIDSYSDFEDTLRVFLHSRLLELISTTHAYSAVVRLYDPYKKQLYIFVEEKGKHTTRVTPIEAISLKNYRQSVNAFTFLDGGRNHEYVYIRNINAAIPDEYHKNGLDSAIKSRKDLLSEICFPLLAGNVPFGTLNIESQVKRAFDDDIQYLIGIKKAVEAFYSNLLHTNDLQWIRSQINRHENIHEIKNDIKMKKFDEKTSKRLTQLLLLDFQEQSAANHKNEPIKERMDSWIDQMYSPLIETQREKIHAILEYNLESNVELPLDLVENVIIILKNLVQNIVSYGDRLHDKVIISTNPFYKIGDRDNIRIYMRTYGIIDSDVIDKIGIAPIRTHHNDIPHYGMFLIGMMTRILGGAMHVSRKSTSDFYVIEIKIPISRGRIHEQT